MAHGMCNFNRISKNCIIRFLHFARWLPATKWHLLRLRKSLFYSKRNGTGRRKSNFNWKIQYNNMKSQYFRFIILSIEIAVCCLPLSHLLCNSVAEAFVDWWSRNRLSCVNRIWNAESCDSAFSENFEWMLMERFADLMPLSRKTLDKLSRIRQHRNSGVGPTKFSHWKHVSSSSGTFYWFSACFYLARFCPLISFPFWMRWMCVCVCVLFVYLFMICISFICCEIIYLMPLILECICVEHSTAFIVMG